MKITALYGVSLFLFAPALVGQDAEGPVVAVVGASVSAGYGIRPSSPLPPPPASLSGPEADAYRAALAKARIDLARLLADVWSASGVTVKQYARSTLFLNPERNGTRMIDQALAEGADLVVAIDFMFWFGYGKSAADEEASLKLQELGLAQLDRIEGHIVVGDYPDVRRADPEMLPREYVPSAELLEKLNARLRGWAEDRPRVHVFELSTWLKSIEAEGDVIEVDGRHLRAGPGDLLQEDRLHATRLGLALLGARVDALAREVLDEQHTLQKPGLIDFVQAAGASMDALRVDGMLPRSVLRAMVSEAVHESPPLPWMPSRRLPVDRAGVGSVASRPGHDGERLDDLLGFRAEGNRPLLADVLALVRT